MNTVTETLNHHLQSFGEGNIDELMADYTEDSIIMFESNRLQGLDDIRTFMNDFITNSLPPGSEFELKHIQVAGNVAYIAWTASSDRLSFKLGTDTFVIIEGKILTQTIAALVEPQ